MVEKVSPFENCLFLPQSLKQWIDKLTGMCVMTFSVRFKRANILKKNKKKKTGEMNCEYCVVATTLQTADTCHVDSCLFHCYIFSVFPFDSVGNYACIKRNVFFSLTPRAWQILPYIVPFNLLHKHMGCQMKWMNLLITWPVSLPNQSEK